MNSLQNIDLTNKDKDQDDNNDNNDNNCPICYSELINPITLSCCNNKICLYCVIKIYDTSNNSLLKCPLCRNEIINKNINNNVSNPIIPIQLSQTQPQYPSYPEYFRRFYDINEVYNLRNQQQQLFYGFNYTSIISNLNKLYDVYEYSEIFNYFSYYNILILSGTSITIKNENDSHKLIIYCEEPHLIYYEFDLKFKGSFNSIDLIETIDSQDETYIMKYLNKLIRRYKTLKELLMGHLFNEKKYYILNMSKYCNRSYVIKFSILNNSVDILKRFHPLSMNLIIKKENEDIIFECDYKDTRYKFSINNYKKFYHSILADHLKILKQYVYDFVNGNNIENYHINVDFKKYKIYTKQTTWNLNNYIFKLKLDDLENEFFDRRINQSIENANN